MAALRQQAAEGEDARRRLQDALEAARQDAALVAQRLRAQLEAAQADNAQLAELVLRLREEADGLREQLQRGALQAEAADRSTAGSLAQLQEAAAEWRALSREQEESLARERARTAALQADLQRMTTEAEAARRQAAAEQATLAQAEAALAALRAQEGGPALVQELRTRCRMERQWRKAVTQWLRGEMQAKGDLERVLLNVGTAARVGHAGADATGQPAAPALPPRRMAAAQLQGVAPASPPPAITVTVVHSSSPVAAGVPADASNNAAGDWRQHFKSTVVAFDERHARLQAELSGLRREALQPLT